jgi:hypothetical protein
MSSDAGSLWTETVEHWLQEDTERSVIGPRCARTKDVLHIERFGENTLTRSLDIRSQLSTSSLA